MTHKRYDKAYFDRWYRGSRRVHSEAEVRRKVALAVAEFSRLSPTLTDTRSLAELSTTVKVLPSVPAVAPFNVQR